MKEHLTAAEQLLLELRLCTHFILNKSEEKINQGIENITNDAFKLFY